jgi:hypothetical protein
MMPRQSLSLRSQGSLQPSALKPVILSAAKNPSWQAGILRCAQNDMARSRFFLTRTTTRFGTDFLEILLDGF